MFDDVGVGARDSSRRRRFQGSCWERREAMEDVQGLGAL